MKALPAAIRLRIQSLPEGVALSPREFLHLGSRAAVDQALSRLTREGKLLRVSRGTYVAPAPSSADTPHPSSTKVVHALAAQSGEVVTRDGAHAARNLGLTRQVSLDEVYLTSGRNRTLKLGRSSVTIRRAPHWMLDLGPSPAGGAVRALAWMGPDHLRHSLPAVRKQLPLSEWRALISVRSTLPSWLAGAIGEEAARSEEMPILSGQDNDEVLESARTARQKGNAGSMLNDKQLRQVVKREFTIELPRATLVQQTTNNPRIYSGAGQVSQAGDGSLDLKLYCNLDPASELLREFGQSTLQSGKFIDEKEYFSLKGVDAFGQEWTSKGIWVTGDVSFPTSSIVIRTKLRSIEAVRPLSKAAPSRTTQMVVPGKYRVPFTHGQPGTTEPGFSACTLDLGEGRTCKLRTRESALVIDVECRPGDPDRFPAIAIEAIGVAVGAHLAPCVSMTRADLEMQQEIRRAEVDAQEHHRLFTPIPLDHPGHFPDFQAFVRKYVEHFHEPYSEIAEYWYRILLGFHSGFENQALILCTAIEGTLSAKFEDEGRPELDFLEQIEKAIPAIKALTTIGARARERLLGSLGLAKTSTASNALHNLSKAGVISAELVKDWKELRNKTAHAAELKMSPTESQLVFNQTCACLELFYRLVMTTIGYKGQICQYSKPGWPEGKIE